jgi:hypothetical protein
MTELVFTFRTELAPDAHPDDAHLLIGGSLADRKALAAKLESLGGVNVRFVSDIVKPRVSRPRKAAVEPAGASSSTEPMLSDNDPPTDDATSVEAITARNKSRRAA